MECNGFDGIIKEGDQVVVRKDKNLKVVQLRRNSKLWIERCKFFLDSSVGYPYGTSFEVVGQKLVKVDKIDPERDLELENEDEEKGTKDNRHLTDTTENQKLSSSEIRSMRKDGVHGEEIVEQLIQNSATFNQKNEFARQKYIKKKKKKYMPVITVLKPTARLLLEMYYNKGPTRICNLRIDSLAQLLTQANVRAGNKMLVAETCVGLVVGAVMERMGGNGKVIQFYSGSHPVKQAVESFDFPKDYHDHLYSYPLYRLGKLGSVHENDAAESQQDITVAEESIHENVHQSDGTAVDLSTECHDVPIQDIENADEGLGNTAEINMSASVEEEACSNCDEKQSVSQGIKRKFQSEVRDEEKERKWQEKQNYLENVKQMIEEKDSDGLLVVTKFHPTPIVMSLIDFVAPSRPIAIFCQYKEPLMDCYVKLRERGGVVLLKLTETWLRGYQVLPNRTHPKVNMSGTGGYLLTGTTVSLDEPPVS